MDLVIFDRLRDDQRMYLRTESNFSGFQDLKLYCQRWIPEKTRGQLIITHGHGEHSDSYQRVIDSLEGEGWSIFAWDWRGHGKSQGQRGFAHHFADYCYDFEAYFNFLLHNQALDPKVPIVLLGHSMGGLIQLRSLVSHPEWQVTSQVLSSPLLGVAIEVPAIKKLAAQVLQNFLPRLTLSSGILNSHLTRDSEVIREFERDVLRHDRICSGVYFGALESAQYVMSYPEKFKLPLLMQISDQDQVVSSAEGKKFFSALTCNKTLKIYSGNKHEVYNDLDRKIVLEDLKKYLSQFSKI